ncbi:zinc finger CCCH domain-containing protein 17-like [Cicer arietinum]|uniref:Zinc finger CCCH domain-containing protein 48-like n=1 Tax=Cicer arietinum TaxID=3827 RepID=A0A1S2YW70_CICAR|nr:zinc finger CCCH domain-containing protein 48-like [Cicer arietinum]XP_027192237.1 zinc finger CCCH domain-containing protein 48-like [Cicer arietinum]
MDMKVARSSRTDRVIGKTCFYWLAGRCNRNPCRFRHSETPLPSTTASHSVDTGYCNARKRHFLSESENDPHDHNKKAVLKRVSGEGRDKTQIVDASRTLSPSICKYWINSNCVHGDQCRNIHSWFSGDWLSRLAKLQGHKKVVSGITHPVGSNKLYSGSTDGTLRTWDCNTGQCDNVMNLGAEVTSLISEGPWIFVGLPNIVKAWNIQTASQFNLDGPKGRVLAMVVGNDTLLAGAEDGIISAWRGNSEPGSPFELVMSLLGHTKSVVCLTIGRHKMLYSGSMDQTIKVWDLDTFECTMTLNGHTNVITSLICWDNYLLSSSLDHTIKIWAATEEGPLKVTYSHSVENGVVALSGMTDAEGKHILLCSRRDNSVCLYELPSFSERGRLFARREIGSIEIGSGGLFFTGDGTGLMTVWKWLEEPKLATSS